MQENLELRRLLAILVNNKSNSKPFLDAKKQAIDFLQSQPGAFLSNSDRQTLEKQNKEKFEAIHAEQTYEDRIESFDFERVLRNFWGEYPKTYAETKI